MKQMTKAFVVVLGVVLVLPWVFKAIAVYFTWVLGAPGMCS